MLHFWPSCLIKSVLDTVSFVGTNYTGIFFSVVVASITLWRTGRKHFKQYGWTGMKTSWRKLIGEGALTGIGAFLLIWMCHLIAAPYGFYTEVEARGEKSAMQSQHLLQDLTSSCASEKSRLSQDVDTWRSAATKAQTEAAVKEGVDQTLQKQNRDQQSSMNGCLSQAMKLLAPEPTKITPLVLRNDTENAALKTTEWLVLTNKTITPVSMNVSCDRFIQSASVQVVGSGILGGGADRLSVNQWQVSVSTPAWTPTSPLLVTLAYRGDNNMVCNFAVR